jgi:hypothetical protein
MFAVSNREIDLRKEKFAPGEERLPDVQPTVKAATVGSIG